MNFKIFVAFLILGSATAWHPHSAKAGNPEPPQGLLKCGAEQMDMYLPMIKGKTVALVVNQTSLVGSKHLADTLVALGINVKVMFAPEHGIREMADAGDKIADGSDPVTGVPMVSLYGAKRKPSPEDLAGLDWVIFDIQDVGLRYYTYISTMHYVMEACAEEKVRFMVLDRPNPNGHYVDGPVLKEGFESFVGMHKVPVVHGMTIGEYANMVNGEGWLAGGKKCGLTVIPLSNYTHRTAYELPVKPSPNLPDMRSIYLYASTCFFEGTVASEGRGTPTPFQVFGHPKSGMGDYYFTPKAMAGAQKPKLMGERCRGMNLSTMTLEELRAMKKVNLSYLIDFYKAFPDKENFFLKTNFFDKLAGSATLREQIIAGKTEAEIRAGWQEDLEAYKLTRKKYMLYAD